MTIQLNRNTALIVFDVWWLLFIALVSTGFNSFYILTIIGFISIVLLPGIITIFALKLRNLEAWSYITLGIGLSLLEVICIVLLGNTIFPFIGIARPLDTPVLINELSLLVATLATVAWFRAKDTTWEINLPSFAISKRDVLFAFTPSVLVGMSVLGAISLNNGGSNAITFCMLILSAIYAAVLMYFARRLSPSVISTALFFMSLSFLFMTSLRGWNVTGHDIQREYLVFQLTKESGVWAIAHLKDAYNACMSITILPTIFANLLGMNDPYVFKILFQILFATVPSIVYLIARRYVGATIGLISAIYFLAFPTFFTDMPFLNRQEIAFIFLALMFFILLEEKISLRLRRILFTLFGIGMVLSHYSTTYTVIALLILVVCGRPVVRYLASFFSRMKLFKHSALYDLMPDAPKDAARITFASVLVLIGVTFMWSSVLTNTSSNSLYRVVAETISVMRSNANEDARSSDVLYSLLSSNTLDSTQILNKYTSEIVIPEREQIPARLLYDDSAVAPYMSFVSSPSYQLPLGSLGETIKSWGIDVHALNSAMRLSLARLLQLFIVVGLCATFVSNRFVKRQFDTEFMLAAAGSLLMLLAIVILPILSIEYGLLRAFQQSLMFLGVFVVLGTLALTLRAPDNVKIGYAGALALVCMLSTTGVFTQLLGGYEPQLNLNNSGPYYDLFYVHDSEVAAAGWLTQAITSDQRAGRPVAIQSDNFAINANPAFLNTDMSHDIEPALVRHDTYVLLGFTNTIKKQAIISYNSDAITYRYPLQFLDDNKDLVYNSGDVHIYR